MGHALQPCPDTAIFCFDANHGARARKVADQLTLHSDGLVTIGRPWTTQRSRPLEAVPCRTHAVRSMHALHPKPRPSRSTPPSRPSGTPATRTCTNPSLPRTGKPPGGLSIDKNDLYKLLNNRTLLGEMKSGAQWVPGAHAPIIRVELWERAQALLSARRRSRKRKKKSIDDSFLLAGLVFGADGRAYSPWRSSVRNGRAYAYYVPQARIARGAASSALPRCSAFELESFVVEQLFRRLREPGYALSLLTADGKAHPHFSPAEVEHALMNIDRVWPLLFTQARWDFLHKVIERVVVGPDGISITISGKGLGRVLLEVIQGNFAAAKESSTRDRLDPAHRR